MLISPFEISQKPINILKEFQESLINPERFLQSQKSKNSNYSIIQKLFLHPNLESLYIFHRTLSNLDDKQIRTNDFKDINIIKFFFSLFEEKSTELISNPSDLLSFFSCYTIGSILCTYLENGIFYPSDFLSFHYFSFFVFFLRSEIPDLRDIAVRYGLLMIKSDSCPSQMIFSFLPYFSIFQEYFPSVSYKNILHIMSLIIDHMNPLPSPIFLDKSLTSSEIDNMDFITIISDISSKEIFDQTHFTSIENQNLAFLQTINPILYQSFMIPKGICSSQSTLCLINEMLKFPSIIQFLSLPNQNFPKLMLHYLNSASPTNLVDALLFFDAFIQSSHNLSSCTLKKFDQSIPHGENIDEHFFLNFLDPYKFIDLIVRDQEVSKIALNIIEDLIDYGFDIISILFQNGLIVALDEVFSFLQFENKKQITLLSTKILLNGSEEEVKCFMESHLFKSIFDILNSIGENNLLEFLNSFLMNLRKYYIVNIEQSKISLSDENAENNESHESYESHENAEKNDNLDSRQNTIAIFSSEKIIECLDYILSSYDPNNEISITASIIYHYIGTH